MKVLNLQCGAQHAFEGWFGSELDFQEQLERGLLTCPMCGDARIVKMPSAPRLNLHASAKSQPKHSDATSDAGQSHERASGRSLQSQPETALSADGGPPPDVASQMQVQGAFMMALREVINRTEDVGHHFPEQVRRMHHGETQARPIRGQATAEERAELQDEGIEVMQLPMLPGLKETLQ